ncbi:hypothetical protein [Chroococcidiopsis sp [FACHB-1243]]|uniref:hypothetical protein n=1 Tax=Chroococcidiopsis sp. [FACHB-1243] TaxID=2692781 RepID=UPI00177B257C|nr:hypothetical protein [Chroococcidiopsis sp. [FACHB-1243]]
MNCKSNSKTTQPTVQADTATNWQNCVEDLSNDPQADVSSGAIRYVTDEAEWQKSCSNILLL